MKKFLFHFSSCVYKLFVVVVVVFFCEKVYFRGEMKKKITLKKKTQTSYI
jgi:hypothetical protein